MNLNYNPCKIKFSSSSSSSLSSKQGVLIELILCFGLCDRGLDMPTLKKWCTDTPIPL